MPTITVDQFTGQSFSEVTFEAHFGDVFFVGNTSTTVTLGNVLNPALTTILRGTGFSVVGGVPVSGTLTSIEFYDSAAGVSGDLVAVLSGLSVSVLDFLAAIEDESDEAFDALFADFDIVFDASTVASEETTFNDAFFALGDTAIAGPGGSYMELGEFTDTYVAGTGFDQISFANEYGFFGAVVNLQTGTISDTYGNTETLVTGPGAQFESLRGSMNNDSLTGNAVNNQLRGLAGNDLLDGGAGIDTVRYDRDVNYGGFFGVFVELEFGTATDGFGGTDTLIGIENVTGTMFDDQIEGDAEDNVLLGLGGSDRLWGGEGNDTINPGDNDAGFDVLELSEGNDTYVFSDANESSAYMEITAETAPVQIVFTINGAANTGSIDKGMFGTDTLVDIARPLNAGNNEGGLGLVGGDVGDIFNVNNTAQQWMQVRSSAGDDVFNITAGFVRADYGSVTSGGIVADLAGGTISGGADVGTDTINGDLWEVRGTSFSDTMTGSGADESFISFGGNNVIDGGGGFDRLRYDQGGIDFVFVDLNSNIATGERSGAGFADTVSNIEWVRGSRDGSDGLLGSGVANRLEGRGGNDMLDGRGGNDQLIGGDGNDLLIGGNGADVLEGGNGDDLLHGNAGDDTLDGGDGIDTASYQNATGAVNVRLAAALDIGGGEGIDTFISIENVIGSQFGDRLVGDAEDNVLSGGEGDDVIFGQSGNDIIDGWIGNDELYGADGNDTISGGNGADMLSGLRGADTLDGGDGNDVIYGGRGFDTITGGAGNDQIFGQEGDDLMFGNNGADEIYGGIGRDTIHGGNGDDIINGEAARDVIFGDTGADIIRGGTAKDIIDGGIGDDVLFGGDANDVLFGGTGDNVLRGGNGPASGDGNRDIFVFKSAANGGSEGIDRIRDFENGIDKLDLGESGYTSFADVLADATDVGPHMRIDWDFAGELIIQNFSVAQFNDGDVIGL